MIIPSFQGELDLPLDVDVFFQRLRRITEQMGKPGAYTFQKTSPNAAQLTSKRLNPFGYTFNNAVVIATPLSDNHIHIRYQVSFIKWFLTMLFLCFQLLVAFAILLFLWYRRLGENITTAHFTVIFISLTFWAVIWPFIMTFIYRFLLSRMFRVMLHTTSLVRHMPD